MKKKNGFTLVELMISLFLIVSLGAIVMNIYISTLRGTRKSNTEARVRENGNYAISQMTRELQYSQVVSSCDGTITDSVQIINSSGVNVSYSCDDTSNILRDDGNRNQMLDGTYVRISEGTCRIECVGTSPKQVRINYVLEDLVENALPENNASILFKTTVVLRNYN